MKQLDPAELHTYVERRKPVRAVQLKDPNSYWNRTALIDLFKSHCEGQHGTVLNETLPPYVVGGIERKPETLIIGFGRYRDNGRYIEWSEARVEIPVGHYLVSDPEHTRLSVVPGEIFEDKYEVTP